MGGICVAGDGKNGVLLEAGDMLVVDAVGLPVPIVVVAVCVVVVVVVVVVVSAGAFSIEKLNRSFVGVRNVAVRRAAFALRVSASSSSSSSSASSSSSSPSSLSSSSSCASASASACESVWRATIIAEVAAKVAAELGTFTDVPACAFATAGVVVAATLGDAEPNDNFLTVVESFAPLLTGALCRLLRSGVVLVAGCCCCCGCFRRCCCCRRRRRRRRRRMSYWRKRKRRRASSCCCCRRGGRRFFCTKLKRDRRDARRRWRRLLVLRLPEDEFRFRRHSGCDNGGCRQRSSRRCCGCCRRFISRCAFDLHRL